jgi:hypothetical protein
MGERVEIHPDQLTVDDVLDLIEAERKGNTMADSTKCRAQVHEACEDGVQSRHWRDDGTFDGATVVCDPCYIALGTPVNEDLPAAIERAKRVYR